jgi:hypothetical protein
MYASLNDKYSKEKYHGKYGPNIDGVIQYNPSIKEGGEDMKGNSRHSAFIGLGHEIGHAIDERISGSFNYEIRSAKPLEWWDYWLGLKPRPVEDFPNDVERFAVNFENIIRWGYNKDPEFQRSRY